jgi:hypothetical protein
LDMLDGRRLRDAKMKERNSELNSIHLYVYM